jgi:hypothetical protein
MPRVNSAPTRWRKIKDSHRFRSADLIDQHNDDTRLFHDQRTLQPDPGGFHSTHSLMGVLIGPFPTPFTQEHTDPKIGFP